MTLKIDALKNFTSKIINKTSGTKNNLQDTADASLFKNVSLSDSKTDSSVSDSVTEGIANNNSKENTRIFSDAKDLNPTASEIEDEINTTIESLEETFAKSIQAEENNNTESEQNVDPSPLDLNLAAYNDKETISWSLSFILFLRQLVASFFQYTTLSLYMPQIASRFGPSYPSSMPIAYLFIGIIVGATASFTSLMNLKVLSGGFAACVFIVLTGFGAYRGVCTLICLFSHRRSDDIIASAAVALPVVMFTLTGSATALILNPSDLFVGLAIASMLSASFAVSIILTLPQDPVNSLGTMTIGGMVIILIITLIIGFLLINPIVMVSLIGTGLFIRLVIGYFLYLNHVRASRDLIIATVQISIIAMLLNLACVGESYPIINSYIKLFNV